ncbi:hypothetical protein GCM10023335_07460 [Streptomyces siamensis]|uniref:Uncharacterized protein n=1 Tax=Streptomyces siamensis TaxID=1274986 RepID=A0ABP9IG31_9ACTN
MRRLIRVADVEAIHAGVVRGRRSLPLRLGTPSSRAPLATHRLWARLAVRSVRGRLVACCR